MLAKYGETKHVGKIILVNVGNTPSIFFSMDSNGSPFFSGYETRPGSGHGIAGDVFGRLEKFLASDRFSDPEVMAGTCLEHQEE